MRRSRLIAKRLRRSAFFAICLPVVLFVSACGGDDSSPAPTPSIVPTSPVAVAPTAAASPQPIAIAEIIWTSAVDPVTRSPVDRAEALSASAPAIIAVVSTTSMPPGTTIAASWFYNDAPVRSGDAVAANQVVVPESGASGWAAFTLNRDRLDSWPVGRYTVVISANGGPPTTATIEVVNG